MVLFVSYSGALGGAERLLLDFAGETGLECALACPPGPLADAAGALGLRTFALRPRSLQLRAGLRDRVRALLDLVGHRLEVTRLACHLEPALLVAWGMRSALVAPAAAGHAGALAFQHNDFLPGPLIAAGVRRAARQMALVTAPSAAVARELSGAEPVRVEVIPPGVDLDRFTVRDEPAAPPEILVLGALTAWKRPELALEVFARVRARFPEARLRLAGTPLPGDGDDVVRALAARARRPDLAGHVELVGQLSDPAAALGQASCLLHCAEREPFGIAIVEALASARPAVVPDSGGPAEIVDGSCGRRYPPGDAAAAAAAVVEVLGDRALASALGTAGRARAATQFALPEQRRRYSAAMRSVLPTRARSGRASDLAIVTVTHNSAADLEAFLRSCARHLPGVAVIVADCASSDHTRELARAAGAQVLDLPNLGFGRASKRALAQVESAAVALLNPDVELIDDSLLDAAGAALLPDAPERLLAPRVLNPDGSVQDTVHPAPLSGADLARALLPPAALPGRTGVALAPWRSPGAREVGWAVGCALVARTDTLRRLGPFNERIFLYGEDMELGLRAGDAGVPTWFWPSARVIHHGGHSIEVAYGGEAFELRAKARHDAVALARGRRAAMLDDAVQAFTFASRHWLKRALGQPADRERRQLAAVRRWRRA